MTTHDWIKSDLPDVEALWVYSAVGGNGPGMGWSVDYVVYETTHPDLVLLVISTDDNPIESGLQELGPDDELPVDETYKYNFYLDDGTCEVHEADMFQELKRDTWMTDVLGYVDVDVPENERPGAPLGN